MSSEDPNFGALRDEQGDATWYCDGCNQPKPTEECWPCKTPEGRQTLCASCRDAPNVEPVTLADGGDHPSGGIKRVEHLPEGSTVHYAPRTGGADTRVHTDRECRHLDGVDPVFSGTVGTLAQHRLVCQECCGNPNFGPEKGVDVNATRKKLSELNPDDLGLSAMGERPVRTGTERRRSS